MSRLPTSGSDAGSWGAVLNDFLSQSYNANGTFKNTLLAVDSLGLSRVLGRFRSLAAGDLALTRSGNDYSLCYGWGEGRYWQAWLRADSAEPGGYTLNQLRDQLEVVPMLSKDDTDASVVYAGGGWTGPNAQAATYGGTYTFSATTGATATWTTPAAVTRVGVRIVRATNGGLFKVSIDGDTTAANLLPTAQNVVDSGAYPSSILAVNGGTLAPGDRVLDSFGSATTYDNKIVLADNLTAAVHVVVLTVAGYTHTGGSAARGYLSGVSYALAGTTVSTALTELFSIATLNSSLGSAWEYALEVLPSGASTYTFLGNIHGYEVQDSLTFTVDGAAVTPADGSVRTPDNSIEVTRTSHLVHPETAATVIANIVTVYHLDWNGLRVDVQITWAATAGVQAAYVMMPLNGSLSSDQGFSRADILTFGNGPIGLPGSADTYFGNVKSPAAWMWGGNYGALMWVPNVADWTNNWARSTNFLAVEDRNGNTSKIYVGRIWHGTGQTESVAAGTVWNASTQYLIGRFPGGAEATLGNGIVATVPAPAPDPLMGNNVYREPFARQGDALSARTSGVMYLVAVKLYAGDTVAALSFVSGNTALTMGSGADGHIWAALYDPQLKLMAQSADGGGAATWAANAIKTFTLSAKQTISVAGTYYVGLMVNAGTGAAPAPVMPSFRGRTWTANVVAGSAGWPTGAKALAGTNGAALTATAPAGPLTLGGWPDATYFMTS